MRGNSQRMAQTHEKQIAERLAEATGRPARVQPGSGNQPGAPNDVLVPNHSMVECKATNATSIILKRSWAHEARQKAALCGAGAVYLALRIHGRDYFVADDEEFYHLLECERHLAAILSDAK